MIVCYHLFQRKMGKRNVGYLVFVIWLGTGKSDMGSYKLVSKDKTQAGTRKTHQLFFSENFVIAGTISAIMRGERAFRVQGVPGQFHFALQKWYNWLHQNLRLLIFSVFS